MKPKDVAFKSFYVRRTPGCQEIYLSSGLRFKSNMGIRLTSQTKVNLSVADAVLGRQALDRVQATPRIATVAPRE